MTSATEMDAAPAHLDWPALEPDRVPQSTGWGGDLRWHGGRLQPKRPEAPREPIDPRQRLPQAPLSPLSRQWMAALPLTVRPGITARRHPHVVNRLAAAWDDGELLAATFGALMLVDRPGRRGFDLDVLAELVNLQGYSAQPRRR